MSFIAFIFWVDMRNDWNKIKIILLFCCRQGKSLAATRHQKRFSRLKIHGHPSLNNSKIITSFVHCVYHITHDHCFSTDVLHLFHSILPSLSSVVHELDLNSSHYYFIRFILLKCHIKWSSSVNVWLIKYKYWDQ